jgi:glucose-6-phosphate isomerase
METIFENSKTIKKSDILVHIGIGISIIITAYFFSKLRHINKPENNETYLIMGIGLLILFLYQALASKTIKRIEKQESKNKLIFTISYQLRKERIKEFNLAEVKLNLKTIPGRTLPYKKVLLISDNENELKLSTHQKGITEIELNKIINGIKNTTHNTV